MRGNADESVRQPESELMIEGHLEVLDLGGWKSGRRMVKVKFKGKNEWSVEERDRIQSWIQVKQSFMLNGMEKESLSDQIVNVEDKSRVNLDMMKKTDTCVESEA
jgi:hypothetical protein